MKISGAEVDIVRAFVSPDGRHAAYRMDHLSPADHRDLFGDLLAAVWHVVAPSRDAVERIAALIPGVTPVALAHPQTGIVFPINVRRGSATDICRLGAIGPHTGSASLLALARHARLNHPDLRFHVIGFADVDAALQAFGNVTVTGKYEPDDLPDLVDATGERIALFRRGWPETFSSTRSEAVELGLMPVVPDIGAPAERAREAGLGVIYPFPIDVAQVASVLQGIAAGTVPFGQGGGPPSGFDTTDTMTGCGGCIMAPAWGGGGGRGPPPGAA